MADDGAVVYRSRILGIPKVEFLLLWLLIRIRNLLRERFSVPNLHPKCLLYFFRQLIDAMCFTGVLASPDTPEKIARANSYRAILRRARTTESAISWIR